MLRRLLGATLALALVASSLKWSTPEAMTRAARDHPWISDALWYGWLICAGGFLAALIIVCPTVVLLRRGRAVVRPLVALTFSLWAVTTYLVATTSDGGLSRHLWWSNIVGLVWLVSLAGLLLTVCVLAPIRLSRRASRPPVEPPAGWRLDPMTGRQVPR
jgi:hypothetical protein